MVQASISFYALVKVRYTITIQERLKAYLHSFLCQKSLFDIEYGVSDVGYKAQRDDHRKDGDGDNPEAGIDDQIPGGKRRNLTHRTSE